MKTYQHSHTDTSPFLKPLIVVSVLMVIGIVVLIIVFMFTANKNKQSTNIENLIEISVGNYGLKLADTVDKPQLVADCYAGNKVNVEAVTLANPVENKVVTIQCQTKGNIYEPIITDVVAK